VPTGTPDSHLRFLITIVSDPTTIDSGSPPANANAVGIPPAAGTGANVDRAAVEAVTSAIAAASAVTAAITACVSATITPAAAPASAGLCGRGRTTYQNSRRASDVDEQQSQRCEAARQDIVALSHSGISGSLPSIRTSALSRSRRARRSLVRMRKTIFVLRFLRAGGTLLRGACKVKLQSDLLQISGVHLPEYLLNGEDGVA